MSENAELFQGPVPKWKPSLEDMAVTERLLASDNELDRAYGGVYRAGCFVTEFGLGDGGSSIAAVGEMDTIAIIEFRLGKEINPTTDLSMGDCISLNAYPGRGSTRAESVIDGLNQVLEARNNENKLDELELFSSFTKKGYKIDAFIPRHSGQPAQWTVKVYREGEEDLIREEVIPMLYEPRFGVDADDKATLEIRVEQLMSDHHRN